MFLKTNTFNAHIATTWMADNVLFLNVMKDLSFTIFPNSLARTTTFYSYSLIYIQI